MVSSQVDFNDTGIANLSLLRSCEYKLYKLRGRAVVKVNLIGRIFVRLMNPQLVSICSSNYETWPFEMRFYQNGN